MALETEDLPFDPVTAIIGELTKRRKSEISVSTAFEARI
jgi:hypothetical protein